MRLSDFREGLGVVAMSLEALFPLRTLIRLVEKGLVTIRTNSTNGIITARITNRGRYIVEQMRGGISDVPIYVKGEPKELEAFGSVAPSSPR